MEIGKKLFEKSSTYNDFLYEIEEILEKKQSMSIQDIERYFDYWERKSFMDLWQDGYSPKDAIDYTRNEKGNISWVY